MKGKSNRIPNQTETQNETKSIENWKPNIQSKTELESDENKLESGLTD